MVDYWRQFKNNFKSKEGRKDEGWTVREKKYIKWWKGTSISILFLSFFYVYVCTCFVYYVLSHTYRMLEEKDEKDEKKK